MRGLRWSFPALAVVLLAAGTSAWAQAPRRDAADVRIRGRVVRVAPTGNSFVVRTDVGKEVTLYGADRTKYLMGGRAARFQDVREGLYIQGAYATEGDRYILGSLNLSEEPFREEREPRDREPEPRDRDSSANMVRGQVMKAHSEPNHLVVRTEDGKEMLLYLPERVEMTFQFETREGKRILVGMRAARGEPAAPAGREEAREPAASPTELAGTIVRVADKDNLFILKTSDGREVTFYSDPQAVYEFDGRRAAYSDLRQGASVNVTYDVRDRKHYARRIIGARRR